MIIILFGSKNSQTEMIEVLILQNPINYNNNYR